MFLPVYAIIGIAVFFHVLLPVLGAFGLRDGWRRFRARVIRLSMAPRLLYRDVAAGIAAPRGAGVEERDWRLSGRIEAFEGEELLWVRGEGVSAVVDLSKAPLYILEPAGEAGPGWDHERAESVERLPWKRVRILSEGTKLFVAGRVSFGSGKPVFTDCPGAPLVAVSWDGEEAELLPRLVAGGRRRNEYWNHVTRSSIAAGIGATSLFLLLAVWPGYPIPTIRTLSFLAALGPALPFLPPGLLLFFAYRRLWRLALDLRIARDLSLLALRHGESPSVALPGGGTWAARSVRGAEPPAEAVRIAASDPLAAWLPGRSGAGSAGVWTVFGAEGSDDPLLGSLALPGEPGGAVEGFRRGARLATALAGLCLVLAVLVNYALGLAAWRFFR